MDVSEIRKCKEEFEACLVKSMEEFVDKTGVKIAGISLQRVTTLDGDVYDYNVTLEVEL